MHKKPTKPFIEGKQVRQECEGEKVIYAQRKKTLLTGRDFFNFSEYDYKLSSVL